MIRRRAIRTIATCAALAIGCPAQRSSEPVPLSAFIPEYASRFCGFLFGCCDDAFLARRRRTYGASASECESRVVGAFFPPDAGPRDGGFVYDPVAGQTCLVGLRRVSCPGGYFLNAVRDDAARQCSYAIGGVAGEGSACSPSISCAPHHECVQAGAGATCKRLRLAGETCDLRQGVNCEAPLWCDVATRACRDPLALSANCTRIYTECPDAGAACFTETQQPCVAQAYCTGDPGVCKLRKDVGGACTRSDECVSERCSGNLCVAADCSGRPDAGAGDAPDGGDGG